MQKPLLIILLPFPAPSHKRIKCANNKKEIYTGNMNWCRGKGKQTVKSLICEQNRNRTC